MLCQIWKYVSGVETHMQVSMSPFYHNSKATLASWKVGWFVNSYQLRSVSWVPLRAMTRLSTWFVHHNLVRWYVFFYLLPSSAGLPHRLPDSVCPAAVLQHVLGPPQQLRETNSAVSRPLARPTLLSQHTHTLHSPVPSLLLPRHFCSRGEIHSKWKEAEWWGEGGNPLGFDEKGRRRARTCTCLKSPHLYIHAKEGQTSREEERGVRWPGSAF